MRHQGNHSLVFMMSAFSCWSSMGFLKSWMLSWCAWEKSCPFRNQLIVIWNTLRPHLFHPLCGPYSTGPPDILVFPWKIFKIFIYIFTNGFNPTPFTTAYFKSFRWFRNGVWCSSRVAVGSRPLVRVLISVLQPIDEDGIGVSAVSVRLVVAVGGVEWIFVTSSASVFSPAAILCPSPSVVWLSVVMMMTVLTSFSRLGIFGKALLVLASSCFSVSAITRLWVSQRSPWLNLPHLRHRLIGFLASSGFFGGWNFNGLDASFLC